MERKHRQFLTSILPVTSQYVNRQYTVASLTLPTTIMYYLLTTTRTFHDNREKKEVTTSLRKTKNVNNITFCHILLIAYLFTVEEFLLSDILLHYSSLSSETESIFLPYDN